MAIDDKEDKGGNGSQDKSIVQDQEITPGQEAAEQSAESEHSVGSEESTPPKEKAPEINRYQVHVECYDKKNKTGILST